MKKIYVFLVELPTFINKYVYFLTGFKYTHFSISFDNNFEKLYDFQKKNIYTTLIGGFVEDKEVLFFHGKKNIKINEIIYEIPVTDEEYKNMYQYVNDIKNDKEYIFNYVSCWLMFPLHGIKAYKGFHCSEFICEVLKYKKDFLFPKKIYKMMPKDIYNMLEKYDHVYKTISSDDFVEKEMDYLFIKKIKMSSRIKKSLYSIRESFCRVILKRTSKNFDYKMVNLYEEDIIE